MLYIYIQVVAWQVMPMAPTDMLGGIFGWFGDLGVWMYSIIKTCLKVYWTPLAIVFVIYIYKG